MNHQELYVPAYFTIGVLIIFVAVIGKIRSGERFEEEWICAPILVVLWPIFLVAMSVYWYQKTRMFFRTRILDQAGIKWKLQGKTWCNVEIPLNDKDYIWFGAAMENEWSHVIKSTYQDMMNRPGGKGVESLIEYYLKIKKSEQL